MMNTSQKAWLFVASVSVIPAMNQRSCEDLQRVERAERVVVGSRCRKMDEKKGEKSCPRIRMMDWS